MSLRFGILSFAHMHAASYADQITQLPGAELVGIADHDDARAQKMAERFKTRAFPSYDALLREGLDAVVVCSENARHRELVEMAAAARVAILCEKPLATTVEDGAAMIRICQDNGVSLHTAFPCRFHPAYRRLRQTVTAGQLGKLIGARCTNQGRNPGGWFLDKKLAGGGAGIDHTVHVADLLRNLTGAEPTTVYAEIGNGMTHGDFDDVAMLHIGFDSGLFATLDASWSRPKSYWTWGNVTLYLTGTGGTAGLDMFAQNHVVFSDGSMRANLSNWGDNIDRNLMQAYVTTLSGGDPGEIPVATGEDGLQAARVAFAAYRSFEEGQPVAV